MTYYVGAMPVGDHLEHHGIKGMRWGQRRFQNDDGSLTALGRARYGVSREGRARRASTMASMNRSAANRTNSKLLKSIYGVNERYYSKKANRLSKRSAVENIRRAGGVKASSKISRNVIKSKASKAGLNAKNFYKKNKKAIKIGAAVAGTAAAAALGYKYRKQIGAAAKSVGAKIPNAFSQAKFDAGRYARVAGNKAKTAYAKGVVGAKGIARKAGSSAKGIYSQAKFDAGRYARVASNKAKTAAAKGVVGAKGAARKVSSSAKGIYSQAKFDAGRYARVAGNKAKAAAAKGVVGAKGAARKLGSSTAKFNASRYARAAGNRARTAVAKGIVGAKHASKSSAQFVKRNKKAIGIAAGAGMTAYGAYGVRKQAKKYKAARQRGRNYKR